MSTHVNQGQNGFKYNTNYTEITATKKTATDGN